jgi:hypothetical protein
MKTYISIISLGIALAASQATFAADKGQIIPRKDLPANLKGGKVAKSSDGIPSCTKGRAVISASDERIKEWAAGHQDHACADSSEVYACRVAGNLSVRCE